MSKNGRKFSVMGKKLIEDHRVKGGVRVSPGVSDKNRKIGECARGQDLVGRKTCFKTHAAVKNRGRNKK